MILHLPAIKFRGIFTLEKIKMKKNLLKKWYNSPIHFRFGSKIGEQSLGKLNDFPSTAMVAVRVGVATITSETIMSWEVCYSKLNLL